MRGRSPGPLGKPADRDRPRPCNRTRRLAAPYRKYYAAIGVRAALAIPLMKAGRLRAILSMHDA